MERNLSSGLSVRKLTAFAVTFAVLSFPVSSLASHVIQEFDSFTTTVGFSWFLSTSSSSVPRAEIDQGTLHLVTSFTYGLGASASHMFQTDGWGICTTDFDARQLNHGTALYSNDLIVTVDTRDRRITSRKFALSTDWILGNPPPEWGGLWKHYSVSYMVSKPSEVYFQFAAVTIRDGIPLEVLVDNYHTSCTIL